MILGQSVWAGQNVLDTDSFNGTNGNVLSTYNANWVKQNPAVDEVIIAGTPGIGVNPASSPNADYRTGKTWTNDQWAEFTLDSTNTLGQIVQVQVRAQTNNTVSGYVGGPNFFGASHHFIQRYDSGSATTLLDTGVVAQKGDVVNLQIVGSVLTISVNGSSIGTYDTASDGTKYSTGNPGLFLQDGGTPSTRFAGSWRAGSVSGSVSGGVHNLPLMGVGQ